MPPEWAEAAQAFSSGLLDPSRQTPHIVLPGQDRRYGVYRNNVTIGLVNALAANFPATRKLLGETYFDGFARDFVRAHPPASRLLFEYGDAFPEFIAAAGDLAHYPYLADVARLELLWLKAYHAPDCLPLTAEALARIDPDRLPDLRFRQHPAAQLFSSKFAAVSIFSANRGAAANQSIDPLKPECAVIVRPELAVDVVTVDGAVFEFLSRLCGGEAFADAAAADDTIDISVALRIALTHGIFSETTDA